MHMHTGSEDHGQRPARRRRDIRAEESRQDILNAAIHLLANRGLTAVTLRNVAKEAGISYGSIWFHFGSRAGLLCEVIRETQVRLTRVMKPVVVNPPSDPREQIIALVDAFVSWVSNDPDSARAAMLVQAEKDQWPTIWEPVRAETRDGLKILSAQMRAAVAAGSVRSDANESFWDFLVGSLQGVLVRADSYELDPRPLLEMVRRAALSDLGISDDAARTS